MSARPTQRKGDTALTQGIATFTRKGWDVSIPITESAAYDLVVEIKGKLKRVQVKYGGAKNGLVDLRHIWSNSKGYQVTGPEKGSFDLIYVFSPSGKEYLVEKEHFNGKNTVKPRENELLV